MIKLGDLETDAERRLAKQKKMKTTKKVYYITFRIAEETDEENRTPNARRNKLLKEIKKEAIKGKMWEEPSSYVLFSSTKDIDAVARIVHNSISPRIDLAVVGMPYATRMRYIGNIKNSRLLCKFVSFAKKFP